MTTGQDPLQGVAGADRAACEHALARGLVGPAQLAAARATWEQGGRQGSLTLTLVRVAGLDPAAVAALQRAAAGAPGGPGGGARAPSAPVARGGAPADASAVVTLPPPPSGAGRPGGASASGRPGPGGWADTVVAPPDGPADPERPRAGEAGPGARVGPYEVERELARGGMGVVYVARHAGLGRTVALKLLPRGADPELAERFLLEAQAAARLRHPHVVAIHDVGQQDGRHYLAMDLIEGRSLSDRVKRDGPLPPREAAALVRDVADAVAYAHERGVLHRDIKPANILVDAAGRALLTDFGLAKELGEAARPARGLTVTGQVLGTPSYMPPEQADGDLERVDRRADVWALGATLYDLLVGEPPFTGPTPMNVIAKVLSADPPPPRRRRPEVDRDLETVVLRCLEKEPERRYATAGELRDDLRRWLDGEPIRARPVGTFERLTRRARRHRGLVGVGAAGLGLVLVTAVVGAVAARGEAARALDAAMAAEEQRRRAEAAEGDARRAEGEARLAAGEARRAALEARLAAELERGYGLLALGQHRGAVDAFLAARGLADDLAGSAPQDRDEAGSDGAALAARGRAALRGVRWAAGSAGVLEAHDLAARACAFLADGRLVAATSGGLVLVADGAAQGPPLGATTGLLAAAPRGAVVAVAQSPGGADGAAVVLVDLDDRREVSRLRLPPDARAFRAASVAWSRDGRRVACAGLREPWDGGRVVLWDVDGRVLADWRHAQPVYAAAFGLDDHGDVLFTGHPNGEVALWLTSAAGEQAGGFVPHPFGAVTGLAWLPRLGRLVTCGADGALLLHELPRREGEALKTERVADLGAPIARLCARLDDGVEAVAVATRAGGVSTYRALGGSLHPQVRWQVHRGELSALDLSPRGELFAAGAGERVLLHPGGVDLGAGTDPLALGDGAVGWVLMDRDAPLGPVAVCRGEVGRPPALRWEVPARQGGGRAGEGPEVVRPTALLLADGGFVVALSHHHVQHDAARRRFPLVSVDPRGAVRWERDLAAREGERAEGLTRPVEALAAADGVLYAGERFDGAGQLASRIARVALADGAWRPPLPGHTGTVTALVPLAGGRLASASLDGTVVIWEGDRPALQWHATPPLDAPDAPAGRVVEYRAPDEPGRPRPSSTALAAACGVTAAAASRDGALLVTVTADGVARRWRTLDGRLLGEVTVGGAGPLACGLVDDDETLLVAYEDQVRAWDLVTGRALFVARHAPARAAAVGAGRVLVAARRPGANGLRLLEPSPPTVGDDPAAARAAIARRMGWRDLAPAGPR